jgi:hypothetical protein
MSDIAIRVEGLRACLKKTIETRCSRYGVPPLGGFCAAPPKGGTPNRVFKQALSKAYRIGLKEQQHETMLDAMAARLKSPFLPELTVQDGQIMLVS